MFDLILVTIPSRLIRTRGEGSMRVFLLVIKSPLRILGASDI